MPVYPCFCVHDAPGNLCPCPKNIMWWLRRDTLFAKGDAKRKDHDGNDLQYFDVPLDAKIMVETTQSVSASALKRLGTNVGPRSITEVADDDAIPEGGVSGDPEPIAGLIRDVLIGIFGSLIYDLLKDSGHKPEGPPGSKQWYCSWHFPPGFGGICAWASVRRELAVPDIPWRG
jgi:hypothetical protein